VRYRSPVAGIHSNSGHSTRMTSSELRPLIANGERRLRRLQRALMRKEVESNRDQRNQMDIEKLVRLHKGHRWYLEQILRLEAQGQCSAARKDARLRRL
jgi:hypothetical protein